MKVKPLVILAVCVMLVLPAIVLAQSLQMKKLQKEQQDALASDAADLSKTCETEIKTELDLSGAKAEDLERFSYSGLCLAAVKAVGNVCSEEEGGKEAVKKGIKKILCNVGAERKLTLENGTLAFTMVADSANNDEFVTNFLMNKLE